MNDATTGPMSGTKCTLSKALAVFVEAFDLDQVPGDVLDRAKLNILDALGIGFASVGFDFAERLASALSEIGGTGDYPIIGMDLRLSQRDSAHLNGTLIHGLDYDDTHSGAVVHT
ncbi:MAG: MmgE/PrpD family protein, partial [Pseudomonadota bacterium]|nr:MmgE/PrpD family protein [Pseudomonadota bacterium]